MFAKEYPYVIKRIWVTSCIIVHMPVGPLSGFAKCGVDDFRFQRLLIDCLAYLCALLKRKTPNYK